MHRCYVPHADGHDVDLTPDQAHHITRVLRLELGADLIVFDGRGREWLGRLASTTRSGATVTLLASREPLPEPAVAVSLAVGVLKGDQMNDVVRDATALGVVEIVPVISAHAAVSGGNWDRARDRWARVAVSAAMQCGRAVVPSIGEVQSFDACLAYASSAELILCVEPAHAGEADTAVWPRPDRATVLVGPEGGWAREEVAQAVTRGARRLNLGPRTLRAELAPTVALSALWTRWGWP